MKTCLVQDCTGPIKYIFEKVDKTKYYSCSCRKHIEIFMRSVSFTEKIRVFHKTNNQFRKLEDITSLTTKHFKDIYNLFPLSKFDYLQLEMRKTKKHLRSKSVCLKKEYPFHERKQKQHIYNVLLNKKSELVYLSSIMLEEEEPDYDRLYEHNQNICVIDEEVSYISDYFEKYSDCLENIQCIRNLYAKRKNQFILEFSSFNLKWTNTVSKQTKDCSICLNEVFHGEGGHLICGHFFHNDCMKKWVNTNHFSCPNCRAWVDLRKYTYFLDKFE